MNIQQPYYDIQENESQNPPPQQAQQYPPPQNAPQQQYLSKNPVNNPPHPKFGVYPVDCICPYCRTEQTTRISYETGMLTWLVCIIMICFGLILGCCLIPFHVNPLKDVDHKCDKCDRVIHRYERIGGSKG